MKILVLINHIMPTRLTIAWIHSLKITYYLLTFTPNEIEQGYFCTTCLFKIGKTGYKLLTTQMTKMIIFGAIEAISKAVLR